MRNSGGCEGGFNAKEQRSKGVQRHYDVEVLREKLNLLLNLLLKLKFDCLADT